MKRWMQVALVTFFVIGVAAGSYVGGYLLLLRPAELWVGSFGSLEHDRIPGYRCGGAFSELLFAPLVRVDHRIRPTYWSETKRIEPLHVDLPAHLRTSPGQPSP
jgi:hypothetical protein